MGCDARHSIFQYIAAILYAMFNMKAAAVIVIIAGVAFYMNLDSLKYLFD